MMITGKSGMRFDAERIGKTEKSKISKTDIFYVCSWGFLGSSVFYFIYNIVEVM